MRQTLFCEETVNQIIRRVNTLKPDALCKWGTMTLVGMLCHCNKTNQAILEGQEAELRPTFKQRILKIAVLQVIQRLPKGVKSKSIYLQQANQILEFEEEKNKFIATVIRFKNYKGVLNAAHPYFGKLSTQEWGRFAAIHVDHHLRQFGV